MRKVIIGSVIVLILFIIGLSIYKHNFYDNKKEKYYFETIKIENYKEDNKDTESNFEELKEYIIYEERLSIDYNYFHDEKSITGKVYIGNDKHLYISDMTDLTQIKTYKVSTDKYKTMVAKNYYFEGLYIYLITETNELCFIELAGNDVTIAKVYKIETEERYTNLVGLDFTSDIYGNPHSLFVLTSEGKIKDFTSGFSYSDDVLSIFAKIYVFSDFTMTNVLGNKIEDKNGNSYKLKYAFMTYEDNDFTEKNSIILITQDNKMLYFDENILEVYEFNKKVKSVDFSREYTYDKNKLEITFEDDSYVELTASCTMDYCPKNS